jgi:hypothetical protein
MDTNEHEWAATGTLRGFFNAKTRRTIRRSGRQPDLGSGFAALDLDLRVFALKI